MGKRLCVWFAADHVKKESASSQIHTNKINDQGKIIYSILNKNMTTSKPTTPLFKKLFNPRNTIRIGTWNVRTMYSVGTAQVIANEMDRYHHCWEYASQDGQEVDRLS